MSIFITSVSSVSSSATNVTVVAAAATDRVQLLLYNDSSAVCYLKFGATASSSDFTYKMAAGDFWSVPKLGPFTVYSAQVDGIWASANGSLRITEIVSI